MTDPRAEFIIPDRPAFKAAEVCEIAKLQPYVLRSWESEFPDLGVARTPGGPRVYRKADVEQVLRIRHLVFHEGLTLAGVRRRIDGETPSVPKDTAVDASLFQDMIGADLKARLTQLKAGLRSLLDMVSREPAAALGRANPLADFHLEAPVSATVTAAAHASPKRTTTRRKTVEQS